MSRLGVVVNQWMDDDGRPLDNGYLYSYAVGTYTPKNTFTDSTLTTPNANPMQFDGSGRVFDVFLASGGYRLEVRDKDDVVIWEQDDVYAAVDGTDLLNLETEIDQNKEDLVTVFSVYDEDSSPASSTAYTLTLQESSYTAPTAYKQGMTICFKPQLANTTTTPTANVEGLGAVQLKDYDGTDLAANDLLPANYYMFQYDGSQFRLFWRSGDIGTIDLLDDCVTLAKMATGTEGRLITYDSSNDPVLTSTTIQDWKTITDSGDINTALATYTVTGIPASATKVEIRMWGMGTTTGVQPLDMECAYENSGDTWMTTAGDYHGNSTDQSAGVTTSKPWSTNIPYVAVGHNAAAAVDERQNCTIIMEKVNNGTYDTWHIEAQAVAWSAAGFTVQDLGVIDPAVITTRDLSAVRFTWQGGDTWRTGYMTVKALVDVSDL